ncbi:MAG: peptidoglycan DD-metalloendopeptidase family protein [Rhizobiales bacterium]|nr:peptidoglycan DD-metalloendopeptidase family protein [Hyphomicrobiales bacterium]
MSHRSADHCRHSSLSGSGGHASAVAVPGHTARADYTFAHAGHQLRIGPIAFWIVVGTLVIMAGWTIITATYFAFRDEVLTRLISRQAEMQFAYEDRIAEMRAQVDRVTSRQLLDQEQFEQKLDHVLRRQATLESRAAVLGSAADPTVTGSMRGQSRVPVSVDRQNQTRPKPSPISDTIYFLAPIEREARLESRPLPATEGRVVASAKAGGIEGALARLQTSLDHVEAAQAAALNAMEEHYDTRARRMRGVLADLGVDVGKAAAPRAGVGGPFVSVKAAASSAFEGQLYRLRLARAQVERLTQSLTTVPLRKPLADDAESSSGYGVRIDPFLGVPAMHTGHDFRASSGDRVFATASGVVATAGWNGGYGKMIEIRHANGFSTRYAHLSEISVSMGQKVGLGHPIGRVGSTGRSTGPHLHYETRVDGDAIDPQKFLRAGVRLGAHL